MEKKNIVSPKFYDSALLKCCDKCQISWPTKAVMDFYQGEKEKDPQFAELFKEIEESFNQLYIPLIKVKSFRVQVKKYLTNNKRNDGQFLHQNAEVHQ